MGTKRLETSLALLEEFQEFEMSFGKGTIVRKASLGSEISDFWRSKLGAQLRDSGFLAPTTLEVGKQAITLTQRLASPSYPGEWTTTMLAGAGLALLDFLQSGLGQRIRLNESYSRNFQFFDGKPSWVDLGSFTEDEVAGGLRSFQELQFLKNYIIPITLSQHGLQAVSLGMLSSTTLDKISKSEILNLIPTATFWSIKFAPTIIRENLLSAVLAPLWLEDIPPRIRHSKVLSSGFQIFAKLFSEAFLAMRVRSYRRILSRELKKSTREIPNGQGVTNFRDERDEDLLKKVIAMGGSDSVLDFGGASACLMFGDFEAPGVKRYIVLAWDANLVNKLNSRIAQGHRFVEAASYRYNFRNPWLDAQAIPPDQRFASDTVVFHASDQLLLTEQMPPRRMWQTLASFTEDNLLAYFIPSELTTTKPIGGSVDWYTEEYFLSGHSSYFYLRERHELADTRVAFILRRK